MCIYFTHKNTDARVHDKRRVGLGRRASDRVASFSLMRFGSDELLVSIRDTLWFIFSSLPLAVVSSQTHSDMLYQIIINVITFQHVHALYFAQALWRWLSLMLTAANRQITACSSFFRFGFSHKPVRQPEPPVHE